MTSDTVNVDSGELPQPSLYRFASGGLFGRPFLSLMGVAIVFGYRGSLLIALSLIGLVAWVLVDLVVYRTRHGALPPRPVWGLHNRWTVPLYFAAWTFSAVQAF